MNNNYKLNIFHRIINNPKEILLLPKEYQLNIDFLETFYIILKDEIKPYISKKIYETLKHREVLFKNKFNLQPQNKPNISLESEIKILNDILTSPKAIEKLPTDEKYSNACLEFLYLIWGDEIKPYFPPEMFEQFTNETFTEENNDFETEFHQEPFAYLEDETLMREYHLKYEQDCENWAEEENEKVLQKQKIAIKR